MSPRIAWFILSFWPLASFAPALPLGSPPALIAASQPVVAPAPEQRPWRVMALGSASAAGLYFSYRSQEAVHEQIRLINPDFGAPENPPLIDQAMASAKTAGLAMSGTLLAAALASYYVKKKEPKIFYRTALFAAVAGSILSLRSDAATYDQGLFGNGSFDAKTTTFSDAEHLTSGILFGASAFLIVLGVITRQREKHPELKPKPLFSPARLAPNLR